MSTLQLVRTIFLFLAGQRDGPSRTQPLGTSQAEAVETPRNDATRRFRPGVAKSGNGLTAAACCGAEKRQR